MLCALTVRKLKPGAMERNPPLLVQRRRYCLKRTFSHLSGASRMRSRASRSIFCSASRTVAAVRLVPQKSVSVSYALKGCSPA